MSKYELQKHIFKKSKKISMTSFFQSRSGTLPVAVSKAKLRSKPVSEKFCGLGLGRVGLDYSPELLPIYATSLIMFSRPISKPHFNSIIFLSK